MMEKSKKERLFIMVDIETYGTKENAVIREIACVPFMITRSEVTEILDDALHIYVKTDPQVIDGRTMDQSTLAFWHRPENKVVDDRIKKYEDFNGYQPLPAALCFANYMRKMKKNYEVYFIGRGATTFDYPILKNFWDMYNARHVYNCEFSMMYYRITDMRSFLKIMEVATGFVPATAPNDHSAISDCMNQINQLRQALKPLQALTIQSH